MSYDPPRRRKRDQGERSAKHIKHNFYHGPDEGFVDSAPRPETSRDEQEARWNPTSNNEDSGFRGDRRGANASTGRRGGASGVEPVVGWREEDDDLGDDAWQKGWEQWDSSPADADASVVDAPSVGGRQQGAGAEDWRGSAAGTVGDEVDALLEELQCVWGCGIFLWVVLVLWGVVGSGFVFCCRFSGVSATCRSAAVWHMVLMPLLILAQP